MSRLVLVRMLAVLFGLLLFWGAAEVVCRMVFSRVVAYDVEMWRYARELKVFGLTPGLRFEHRPNARAHLMGVDVEINADGLRQGEVSLDKPAETLRIAVVGDSITFGWGVPQEATYPRRLEILLNQQRPLGPQVNFEVINFGVGNYTVEDVAVMLQRKALGYDPDLVIYGAFINDAEASAEIATGFSLLRHSLTAVLVWGRLDNLWRQLGLLDDYREYYRGLYRDGGAGRQRVRGALQTMMTLCRQANIPMLVALLPELHDADGSQFADVRRFYRETATRSGGRFVDLHESLPDNRRRNYWVSADDAHPNAAACDHYARALLEKLPWPELLAQDQPSRF